MRVSKMFETITYISFGLLVIIFLIIEVRYFIFKLIEKKKKNKPRD